MLKGNWKKSAATVIALFSLLVFGLLLAAPRQLTQAAPAGPVSLTAAGATFPYPIYSKWFDEYQKLHPDIAINYQSIGSGGGIQQLKAGTVDFGASDMPLNDKLLSDFSFKILQFPTVLGAVLPTYNIPGVSASLNFTPEALAGIYLGKITKWNDPAIAGPNKGVNLPGEDIVVVHRSDGSGTTFVWTDYLSKVSPDWKSRVGSGTSVNWPQQTPYSIGYVELIYALHSHTNYGTVKNSSGKFVKADLESVTAAAAGASQQMAKDIRVSITDPAEPSAYPICSFTYLLIPVKIADPVKRDTIKQFLHWMLTEGQNDAEPLAYARLPKKVVAIEMSQISEIQ